MSYGVTDQGFVAKPLETIIEDLQTGLRGVFGPQLDLSPASPDGLVLGVFAGAAAELWEGLEGVHAAGDPDAAGGASLDVLAGLTGTVRRSATRSTARLIATGDDGTELPAGRVVSVTGAGSRFATTEGATLAAVPDWAWSTAYQVGDLVTHDGAVYVCTTAGTSVPAGDGPTGTGGDIPDGTVRWLHVGEGEAAAEVLCEAAETGPVAAMAGTLTSIETPVAGWQGVRNLLDAEMGRDAETDTSLRLRREQELRAQGAGALDAVRADLLRVERVESVSVFENVTDTTDVDGLPPHSIEALVLGGDDAAVAAALWETKPGGIRTHGTTIVGVTDSAGESHGVAFSRPEDLDVYVSLTVAVDADFPSNGVDQVKRALAALVLMPGANLYASRLVQRALTVAGVVDVPVMLLGLAPMPVSSAPILASPRQIVRLDTSRIHVITTEAEP